MEKDNNRELLFISFFTLVTVVVWITLELIAASSTSTIPPQVMQLIKPLSPKIKSDVIEIIAAKKSM